MDNFARLYHIQPFRFTVGVMAHPRSCLATSLYIHPRHACDWALCHWANISCWYLWNLLRSGSRCLYLSHPPSIVIPMLARFPASLPVRLLFSKTHRQNLKNGAKRKGHGADRNRTTRKVCWRKPIRSSRLHETALWKGVRAAGGRTHNNRTVLDSVGSCWYQLPKGSTLSGGWFGARCAARKYGSRFHPTGLLSPVSVALRVPPLHSSQQRCRSRTGTITWKNENRLKCKISLMRRECGKDTVWISPFSMKKQFTNIEEDAANHYYMEFQFSLCMKLQHHRRSKGGRRMWILAWPFENDRAEGLSWR